MEHKALQIGLAVFLAVCALFLALTAVGSQTQAQGGSTIYVAPGGDCGGHMPCFDNVQAAVDAADSPDDVVNVAAGTYTGVQGRPAPAGYNGPGTVLQIVYISKTVTVRGGYTTAFTDPPDPEANPTTLDAQDGGRVLFVTGDISPAVEGLRITGGDAAGLGGGEYSWYDVGGGVYVISATATISDNQVFSNTGASWAAGCACGTAPPHSAVTPSPPTPPGGAVGCTCTTAPPRSAVTLSPPTPPVVGAVGCTCIPAPPHSAGTPSLATPLIGAAG